MIRFTWLALSTLLLAAGCAKEQPVEVHGTVERDRLEIIAESNERIVEIVVHEGDHVQAGTCSCGRRPASRNRASTSREPRCSRHSDVSRTWSRVRASAKSLKPAPRSAAPRASYRRRRATMRACRRWCSASC